MVPAVCFFGFVCMILHIFPAENATGAVSPFGGPGTAILLYAGGAMVLSGVKKSLAKIAAVTMLIVFRLPLLISYAVGMAWLYVLYGVMLVLGNVGKSGEK